MCISLFMTTTLSTENQERLERAAGLAHVSSAFLERFSKPRHVRHERLAVNGRTLDAWRVVHNTDLGPGKGGIRFHPDVTKEETASLALWMSIKTALFHLPYGGAKGGVAVDGKQLAAAEREQVSRAYARQFAPYLGEQLDVPAPDVYTDEQVMAWMLDEYEQTTGRFEPAAFTGKPFELGGCRIRANATAHGGAIILTEALRAMNAAEEQLTVAIHGFGNAGANIATMLAEAGHRITVAGDSSGTVYDSDGLDVSALRTAKEQGKGVADALPEAVYTQDPLGISVDLTVLAALSDHVRSDNVEQMDTRYVLELANGPVTNAAEQTLINKNVLILPDVLANAGGVVASYIEWAQNRSGDMFEYEYLLERFRKTMREAWERLYRRYREAPEYGMRAHAYAHALEHIASAAAWRHTELRT